MVLQALLVHRVHEVGLDYQVSLVSMVQKETKESLDREVHLVLVAREVPMV
jgi:hypothetical protein